MEVKTKDAEFAAKLRKLRHDMKASVYVMESLYRIAHLDQAECEERDERFAGARARLTELIDKIGSLYE